LAISYPWRPPCGNELAKKLAIIGIIPVIQQLLKSWEKNPLRGSRIVLVADNKQGFNEKVNVKLLDSDVEVLDIKGVQDRNRGDDVSVLKRKGLVVE